MNIARKLEAPAIEPRMQAFLEKCGCDTNTFIPLTGDCGNRSYFRVEQSGTSKIVMKWQDEDTGVGIKDFTKIAKWLRDNNLSAPAIHEVEECVGNEYSLALLEDLGQEYCTDYNLLGDCIAAMQVPKPLNDLPIFLDSPVYEGHRRVIDWFVPCYLEKKNPDGLVDEYLKLWNDIIESMPKPDMAFAHMDFHTENFLQLSGRGGVKDCGIIDFQDGCIAPTAYDYTNLLKDIRKDVPQETIDLVLEKATSNMIADQKDNFMHWYKLLCVQFHFRLAGQILRLSLVNNRDGLIQYLPRVMGYLYEELKDPMFADIANFFKKNNVEWNCENLNISSEFISSNAF